MSFFSGFFKGIGNSFKSFIFIFDKGLWPYLIYPLLIWIITFCLTIYGINILADVISKWVSEYLSFKNIPDNGHWLSFAKPFLTGWFSYITATVVKIVFWFVTATFSKYILLIVLSPLFAFLSEKTEEKITGKKFPFSVTQLLKDVLRGILISFRNMLFEYLIIILCFAVSLSFPPMIFVTAPFLLFVSWYYVGFVMLDYNSERHKYKFKRSIKFIKSNKGYACGIGCVYWLFMSLPFIVGDVVGIMFGPALAVVGATISFLQIKESTQEGIKN